METSIIRPMSIGIVAENKPLDSKLIDVLPIETLNLMDGELHAETTELKSSGLKEDGTTYTVSVEMGATLEAEWLGETNRATSPDVRRGEQVMIYRTGDSDKYYWRSMGRDDDLRRLETIIYRVSGLPDNVDEEITDENSYYLEVSTHEKTITIRTSQRNDEHCIYTMQFDPGNGQFTVDDDLGNFIQIDTAKTTIHVVNADGSLMEINKKKIHINADESISLATKQFHLETKTLLIESGLMVVECPLNRIKGILHVDALHSNTMQVKAPIMTPGISGAPFIPGPPVPPVEIPAPPVEYPFD